ncbi:MAG: hypothetical protein ABW169_08840 [Sphingobium sp.]
MTTPNLMTVDPQLVAVMAATIPCQKPEVIQDRFGIGVKTWVKIREGEAIRYSVGARLLERLKRDQII